MLNLYIFFFFFKQKTAYEIGVRLVGSEMCIRDSHKGFQVFNDLMDQYQPKWFIHGHMHLNYGANLPRVCTRGGTTVINATERYEFEIPDPVQVPKRKLFGWG